MKIKLYAFNSAQDIPVWLVKSYEVEAEDQGAIRLLHGGFWTCAVSPVTGYGLVALRTDIEPSSSQFEPRILRMGAGAIACETMRSRLYVAAALLAHRHPKPPTPLVVGEYYECLIGAPRVMLLDIKPEVDARFPYHVLMPDNTVIAVPEDALGDVLKWDETRAWSKASARAHFFEDVFEDHKRLTRELDVLLNGEDGAARQASLCDIVSQMRAMKGLKHHQDFVRLIAAANKNALTATAWLKIANKMGTSVERVFELVDKATEAEKD